MKHVGDAPGFAGIDTNDDGEISEEEHQRSPVRSAATQKRKRCPPTPVSGSTNAVPAVRCLNRLQVIVACSALTAPSRAHPFKAKGVRVVRPEQCVVCIKS
jgi:predicted Fe-Mo cluster-binding NifX family protein